MAWRHRMPAALIVRRTAISGKESSKELATEAGSRTHLAGLRRSLRIRVTGTVYCARPRPPGNGYVIQTIVILLGWISCPARPPFLNVLINSQDARFSDDVRLSRPTAIRSMLLGVGSFAFVAAGVVWAN